MGVIYFISCLDCKITRDLDKFYGVDKIQDRDDALEFAKAIKGDSFRAALALSFMGEHQGHKIVFFNEHDGCAEELDPYYDESDYVEDTDFW